MNKNANTESWKSVVLVVVTLTALLVVCYSSFAQPLATKLPTRTNSVAWDIGFTNAVESSKSGNAKELSPVNFTKTMATFGVYLKEPGDQMSYKFTIKNSGELDAKVESIYIIPTNQASDAIFFTTSGLLVGDELDVGQTAEITVTAAFNPNYVNSATNLTKSVTILINYVQNSH
ncbi:MAG: hypothetical protein IJ093_01330 [Bacilli bacterium]|nr:hypothetical protein [Bacilli bacterium]